MSISLFLNSTIVATKEQVSCDLAGETAILQLKSGIYYGLNGVGVRIWELVQEPIRIAEVRETLLEEYDVEPARCESDLLSVLQEMADRELIEVDPH